MIHHKEGTFQGVGQLELYYQSWYPEGKVRAILAIVHGLGAHSVYSKSFAITYEFYEYFWSYHSYSIL
jgi:alpha-beta hydrolase superfamily lysophospholipase